MLHLSMMPDLCPVTSSTTISRKGKQMCISRLSHYTVDHASQGCIHRKICMHSSLLERRTSTRYSIVYSSPGRGGRASVPTGATGGANQ